MLIKQSLSWIGTLLPGRPYTWKSKNILRATGVTCPIPEVDSEDFGGSHGTTKNITFSLSKNYLA
jgi:hypothetical protein